MFVVLWVDDWLLESLRRFSADNIMHPLDEAPAFPRGEQAGDCVSQAVLEGRHYDAACRAGHTLHIAKNKRSSDAVGLAGTSPCNYNGGVRADKLRKSLGLVKVNFLLGHIKNNL